MDERRQKLTIESLARLVDVPVRTIRFYITEGLIPGPEGRGKATTYGREHLQRLRLVRRLADQRVPLADIRAQMEGLTLDEVNALLQEQVQRDAALDQVAQTESPKAYVSALLDRARSLPELPPSPPPSLKAMLLEVPPPQYGQAWRRFELAPGVELHVRHDAEQTYRRLIDRLLHTAGSQPDADQEQTTFGQD